MGFKLIIPCFSFLISLIEMYVIIFACRVADIVPILQKAIQIAQSGTPGKCC